MALHTGQPVDVVKRDTERDKYLTAEEAVEYGLVDHVLESPKIKKLMEMRENGGSNGKVNEDDDNEDDD
ncbi:MAG: ClpP family protease, partial [Chloroflexota bacterium]